MDRTAWRTTIHGVAKELDMTEPLNKKKQHRAKSFTYFLSHFSQWNFRVSCAPFTDVETEAQWALGEGASWPLGSPASLRHSLQRELTDVQVPLQPWQPVGVCCECVLCACHGCAPCTSQAPQSSISLSHGKCTGALLPDGARQVENASVKLLLNLCALTGPLRKDILPGDELWRMASRGKLFKRVKKV